jgi:hypothetical protein
MRHYLVSDRIIRTIAPVISLALIVLIWFVTARLDLMPRSLLAPPDQAARSLLAGFVTGDIWPPLLATLTGAGLGYVIGSLLALVSAAVLANSKWSERFLMAHVLAFQAIPKVALAPLIFIWCGFGLLSNVILVAMSCYYPVFANAFVGFRATDPNLIAMYRAFGSGRFRILLAVQFAGRGQLYFCRPRAWRCLRLDCRGGHGIHLRTSGIGKPDPRSRGNTRFGQRLWRADPAGVARNQCVRARQARALARGVLGSAP